MLEKFKNYISTFVEIKPDDSDPDFIVIFDPNSTFIVEGISYEDSETDCSYSYSKDVYFTDFNKEILEPVIDKELLSSSSIPESLEKGMLVIRYDDNFFVGAKLPYEYKDLSVQDIVKVLWPNHYNDATFLPDVILDPLEDEGGV